METSEARPRAFAFGGLYVKAAVAALVIFAGLEIAYFVLSPLSSSREPSLDFTGDAIGRDFLVTWMSGRSILGYGPAAWIDPSVYNAAMRVMLGANLPPHFWTDPPHLALFTWPSGLLPYLTAYAVWCVLGLALYLLAAMAFVRGRYLLVAVAAPGVAVSIFFGQSGLYTAALMLGGIALLQRQEIIAGILFGILSVRPHLAILIPVVLLLTGRWPALLSMLVTTISLAAAAGVVFGWEIWSAFFGKVMPQLLWLLEHGSGLSYWTISSAFAGARMAGLPAEIAWFLQGLVSILAVAAVIWTYRRNRDPELSLALFVTATFLVTPYGLNSDMVILGCIVAILSQRDDNAALDHWLALAVWSLPVTMMLFGAVWVPFGPLLLMAFATRLLWRLSHESKAQQPLEKEEPPEAGPVPA